MNWAVTENKTRWTAIVDKYQFVIEKTNAGKYNVTVQALPEGSIIRIGVFLQKVAAMVCAERFLNLDTFSKEFWNKPQGGERDTAPQKEKTTQA